MRPLATFFYSFKFKITTLVIALVLFAGIGAGGISLLIAESELRHVIARQELSLLTGAAVFIDNDLQNKRQLLKSLTEEAAIHGVPLEQIQGWLEAHETLRDVFFNVNAFDIDGNLVASLRDRRAKRINIAERKYFQDTVRLQEGDEFVIVFEQLSLATEMDMLGEKILDAMRPPFMLGGQARDVRTSIGIAITAANVAVTPEKLMRAADQALYGVKAAGRNGYAVNPVGAERVVRVR